MGTDGGGSLGKALGGAATAVAEWSTRPLRRMWASSNALDAYALAHMASVAGDALVVVALADSIFFRVPVGEARLKVALYLALTMAPLALAGPLMVTLLDRAGPRRAISAGAAVGRMLMAALAAPRFSSNWVYPAAFVLLALSRAHGITKNGLTMAYSGSERELLAANARLGRMAVAGGLVAALPGIVLLRIGGAASVLSLAAAVYGGTVALNLRLPRPRALGAGAEVGRRGRVPHLSSAVVGAAGLRAANGFLLFLLAFALRRSGQPAYWFGVLAAAAAAGGFLGDTLAPRLPSALREEAVVIACAIGAGIAALLAFEAFSLPVLAAFGLAVGTASESGRLAFQSLMQRSAPLGAHGRVFVRYEVVFQLAWVGGALVPALLPVSFRFGILWLAGFYLALALVYFARPFLEGRGVAGDA